MSKEPKPEAARLTFRIQLLREHVRGRLAEWGLEAAQDPTHQPRAPESRVEVHRPTHPCRVYWRDEPPEVGEHSHGCEKHRGHEGPDQCECGDVLGRDPPPGKEIKVWGEDCGAALDRLLKVWKEAERLMREQAAEDTVALSLTWKEAERLKTLIETAAVQCGRVPDPVAKSVYDKVKATLESVSPTARRQ